jgi:trimethylamine--corrinoid protein Co-methyltransferase
MGFMSMANAASTAPATSAGTIVVADAEIVAAMVLVQMAYPGAPTFHSLMPGITHPRTGAYLGCDATVYAVGVELAHMWGVPTLAGVFGTDAPEPGWQAGASESSGLLLCALCGAETGNGMGLLEGSTVLYPEALLLDSESYHQVRTDAAGLDTSPDALAVDVIKSVGPRGHFLAQRHTRDHVREWDLSELTFRPSEDGGYRDPIQVAREKTEWILKHHYPEPLEDSQRSELSRILEAADRELG